MGLIIKKQEIIFIKMKENHFSPKTQGGSIVIIVSSHAYQGKKYLQLKTCGEAGSRPCKIRRHSDQGLGGFKDAIQELLRV
jgi:NAD(P)H-hydrate repair Nnr-like enzyme with NAD(P)H-hydrate dehydratase domain